MELCFRAIGAHAMAEVCFCMFADVCLKLLPVTLVIANLLAPRANRYQAVQRPHLSQGVPQFFDNLLALQFPLLFFRDVSEEH